MSPFITLIYLLAMARHVEAVKTISRFHFDLSANLSFRILMPDNAFIGTSKSKLNALGKIANDFVADSLTIPLSKFNISTPYVLMEDFSTGYPDEYGNYSGSIGRLQRQDAELAFMWARLDAIVGDPITTGPAYAPGDMVIASTKLKHHTMAMDILDVFDNADDITYSAFASCVYLTAALLSFSIIYEKRQSIFSATSFLRQMMNALWNIFSLVIDQEDAKTVSLKSRLLWTPFAIASFFAVFGYFLNSMSTDQVAERPVAQIESLDDIISGRFPHIPPYILKNNFLYPLLLSARNGSKLNQLLRILQNGNDDSITELKFGGVGMSEKMMRLKHDMRFGSGCLLMPQLYIEHIMKRFLCHDEPEVGLMIREGREMFGGGIVVWMLRNGLDDGLRRFATYKLGSLREFGIIGKMTPMMVQALLDSLARETKWVNMKCMAGYKDDEEKPKPHLQLSSFGKIQTLSLGGIVIAVVLLVYEGIAHLFRPRKSRIAKTVQVVQPLVATATKMRWIHSLKI